MAASGCPEHSVGSRTNGVGGTPLDSPPGVHIGFPGAGFPGEPFSHAHLCPRWALWDVSAGSPHSVSEVHVISASGMSVVVELRLYPSPVRAPPAATMFTLMWKPNSAGLPSSGTRL